VLSLVALSASINTSLLASTIINTNAMNAKAMLALGPANDINPYLRG
jgi:hypothetical protein